MAVTLAESWPIAGSDAAPGKRISLALTVAMHLLLALLLIYGVSWQTKAPEAVQVSLVRAVSPAPTSEALPPPPLPKLEPKLEPKPEPKPEPKLEPRAEPKAPVKPDIAVKEKPKPEPKPDRFQEALKREAEQLERNKKLAGIDKELAQVKASQGVTAKAKDKWVLQIQTKVRGNIVLPPEVRGNPEATFKVVQLPSGEIISVGLAQSSGNAALDAAIERAILKSSPLPKPEQAALFERDLTLVFRPLEN